MKLNWICPICESDKWVNIRKKMWREQLFLNKKLITCGRCKCSSMYPLPTSEELNKINKNYWKIFPNPSKLFSKIRKEQTISRINYIKKFTDLSIIKRILDIGSGSGIFFDQIKEEILDNIEYYAIESDQSMVNILSLKGIKNVFLNVDDIQDYDFNLIIMSHILEHFSNPKEYLKKIYNLIKKGNLLFIEVPNREDLYLDSLGAHIIVFNTSSLYSLLINLGFHIINIATVGYQVSKLMSKKSFLNEI